jgi:hypothetical protein
MTKDEIEEWTIELNSPNFLKCNGMSKCHGQTPESHVPEAGQNRSAEYALKNIFEPADGSQMKS